MHPIEHLRYVARATGADPVALVSETAQALFGLHMEPAGLVLAARRIVEQQLIPLNVYTNLKLKSKMMPQQIIC
jgi:hypothetical protein